MMGFIYLLSGPYRRLRTGDTREIGKLRTEDTREIDKWISERSAVGGIREIVVPPSDCAGVLTGAI